MKCACTGESSPPYNIPMTDSFIIAGKQFQSRLIVGTGKYRSFQETARALEASGADMVTVAVRRVNLDRSKESLLDYIDLNKYFLLPNTAGCYTADDTIPRRDWRAKLGSPIGSSLKSLAIRQRSIRMCKRRSKPRVCWQKKVSPLWLTHPMTLCLQNG